MAKVAGLVAVAMVVVGALLVLVFVVVGGDRGGSFRRRNGNRC